ncbi:MAG: hypothetical protein J6V73_03915 [Spirochaetaceae bacterium]|nr:hypothetical protein [Spirochaetaceae bacterium]
MTKKFDCEKIFFLCVIAVSVLFLLPMLLLSFYNHPSVDDFSYSLTTHEVWQSTHSIFALIAEAAKTSIRYWHTWQGLYSSAFLLSLQPSIFGEAFYALAAVFIILSLYGSAVLFCYYVFHKKLEFGKLESVSFGFLLAMLCLQWMPSALQGIYWFNGAGNYTFFFSVLLVLAVAVISISSEKLEKLTAKACLKIAAASVIAFILSGGNHVTAFIGFLMILGFVVYGLSSRKKSYFIGNILPLLCSAIGLILNFTAPGTKARQAAFQKSGFAKTIILATFRGFENTNTWLNIAIILSLLLMLPFLLRGAKRLVDKGYKFDKPLLVLIIGAAWPCLMFCPPLYAMGHEGDGRLLNTVYFSIVFILFIEALYICGWFVSRTDVNLNKLKEDLKPKSRIFAFAGIAFLAMTLLCACVRTSYGYQAALMIANGRAAQYDREADARAEIAENSAGQDIKFKSFTVKPSLLFFADLSANPDEWPCTDYAKFYNLKSACLEDIE